MKKKRVVIVGGGFAGLNAARILGGASGIQVTVVDRQNYHLFQPLLYQVAMAGLSPADIAAPIRSLLARHKNIRVLHGTAKEIDLLTQEVTTDFGNLPFDYLLLCCGALPTYFGHREWEKYAPSLKTLTQATEIRSRLLSSFEEAERVKDLEIQRQLLTFIVIGGGPTGVELAGAIGELSRFTLARDFRNIDPTMARVILLEAGPRILPSFSEKLASQAMLDLKSLGVQVRLSNFVTNINEEGVEIGEEKIRAATVIWAAGVKGVRFENQEVFEIDKQGRIYVGEDLTIAGHTNIFVAGDQAHVVDKKGNPLPGVAPVAMQQGRFVARTILEDLKGRPRKAFYFADKGQMATIGRSRAIVEFGRIKISGFIAWLIWLIVHIYFLVGFKNRLFVVMSWAWSYITFRRGARLIIEKDDKT